MKVLQSSVFRALISIVIGTLLVKYRVETVTWLTIAVGALFFLSGFVSCVIYYVNKYSLKKAIAAGNTPEQTHLLGGAAFPLGAAGGMILGAVLAFMPDTFINWIALILSILVILCAVGQFIYLAQARKYGTIPLLFWLIPSLLMLVGIYCALQPLQAVSMPLLIIGWALIAYGASELVLAIQLYRLRKSVLANQAIDNSETGDRTDHTV